MSFPKCFLFSHLPVAHVEKPRVQKKQQKNSLLRVSFCDNTPLLSFSPLSFLLSPSRLLPPVSSAFPHCFPTLLPTCFCYILILCVCTVMNILCYEVIGPAGIVGIYPPRPPPPTLRNIRSSKVVWRALHVSRGGNMHATQSQRTQHIKPWLYTGTNAHTHTYTLEK